ncbi:MAG: hypothetical protein ACK5NG_10535 [Chthoniobacterales bacterium]
MGDIILVANPEGKDGDGLLNKVKHISGRCDVRDERAFKAGNTKLRREAMTLACETPD